MLLLQNFIKLYTQKKQEGKNSFVFKNIHTDIHTFIEERNLIDKCLTKLQPSVG